MLRLEEIVKAQPLNLMGEGIKLREGKTKDKGGEKVHPRDSEPPHGESPLTSPASLTSPTLFPSSPTKDIVHFHSLPHFEKVFSKV